jgi:hypothetical protein
MTYGLGMVLDLSDVPVPPRDCCWVLVLVHPCTTLGTSDTVSPPFKRGGERNPAVLRLARLQSIFYRIPSPNFTNFKVVVPPYLNFPPSSIFFLFATLIDNGVIHVMSKFQRYLT